MATITLDIPDELHQRLLALGLATSDFYISALDEALRRRMLLAPTPKPKEEPKRMGRPPGRTREKRTINLEPRIWSWLEARALPVESFSDTCNRVLAEAAKVLP